ncbi:MAG: HAD family phosphatase [Acidobacteria bacterium]|nr:HAD family phosphatase [Acidobacteriota bacterium]
MKSDFRAIIFDFNGVIINDEPLHCELLRQVICEEGMSFNEGDYERYYLGRNDRTCIQIALSRHHRPEMNDAQYIDALVSRKTSYYQEAFCGRDLLFPGIASLIPKLAALYPLAIASGALRSEIVLALSSARIEEHFQLIIAAEDVQCSKPDPEGFILAWQGLRLVMPNLAPEDCLVIEDTTAGITAAKAAGMQCLAVTTSYPASDLALADEVTSELIDWFKRP